MKYTAMKALVAALLVLLISVNTSVTLSPQDSKDIIATPIQNIMNSQVESESLTITNNADFALLGATGVGTRSDPYIINNLQISLSETCIWIQNTTAFFVISNCRFQTGISAPAVMLSNVENGRVENCEFMQGASGISLYNSIDCLIVDNSFYECWNGITLSFAANSSVIGNRIHNNHRGVLIEQSEFCEILNNSIYSNEQYGIEITLLSSNNTIYGNSIGWNDVFEEPQKNAVDGGVDNAFDDGTSIGNFWDDFNDSTPYTISGAGSSTDDFAQLLIDDVNPVLVPIDDTVIDVSTSRNSITWQTFDSFPASYIVKQDGILVARGVWDGEAVTYNLDYLKVGVFDLSISIYDGAGNAATDSILVSVVSFILGGMGTELVMLASGTTLVAFVVLVVLVKRMS
jgi:parallel beta-helix repeat protein